MSFRQPLWQITSDWSETPTSCCFVFISNAFSSHSHEYQQLALLDRKSKINLTHIFEQRHSSYCWYRRERPSIVMASKISMTDRTSFSEATDVSMKCLIVESILFIELHLEIYLGRRERRRYFSLDISSIGIWTDSVGNGYLSPFMSCWEIWLSFPSIISDSIVRSLCTDNPLFPLFVILLPHTERDERKRESSITPHYLVLLSISLF